MRHAESGGLELAYVVPDAVENPCLELAYSYDGTLEGLLSAVFAAYERAEHPAEVLREDAPQLRLGQRVDFIPGNPSHAKRVKDGLDKRFGPKLFEVLRTVSLSDDPGAATAIYRFIRFAMDTRSPRAFDRRNNPLSQISHPCVRPIFELNRSVCNEAEYARQFVRFQQAESGLWFARYKPKASILPLVMPWFCARYNTQAFVIYDEAHELAGVYEGFDWYLVPTKGIQVPEISAEEGLMQEAWKRFYQVLSIRERYNPELRRTHMPVRFWENLTEMQASGSNSLVSRV